jgi:peroxiredoxin
MNAPIFIAGLKLIKITPYLLFLLSLVPISSAEKLPDFKAFDIHGKLVDTSRIEEKVILVLFFDPANSNDRAILFYSQVLFNKFKFRGLEILAIAQNNREMLEALSEKPELAIRLIFDRQKKIYGLFNIKQCCGGIIIADRDRIITFQLAALVDKESLRQLVEKEVTGSISYDFALPDKFHNLDVNGTAIYIDLRDVTNGNHRTLQAFQEDYLILTFFSSVCGVCKSGRRLETLKKLEKGIKQRMGNSKILAIFVDPLDDLEVREWKRQVTIPFEIFISKNIFTDDHLYITSDALKVDPLTIVLDKKRCPVFVEEFGMVENIIQNAIENIISY